MLSDFIELLEKYAKSNGWPQWVIDYVINLVLPIGFVFLAFSLVYSLLKHYWNYRSVRIVNKNVGPYYSNIDVTNSTKLFIQTKFQNVTPTDEDEPGQTYISSATEKLIPLFINKVFKNSDHAKKYYILLADTGMGKTTFLINLIIRYNNKLILPWRKFQYSIKLLSLGSNDWVSEVNKIENKDNTILLLDALDEDVKASENYEERFKELIEYTWKFRIIIITCRTQFYPTQKDEPYETGAYSYGDSGEYKFQKLYISPFNEYECIKYITKKYPLYKIWKIKKFIKAYRVLKRCRFLLMRPMLLSHIDDLITSKGKLFYTFQMYEILIQKWISRESKKSGIKQKYGSIEKYESLLYQFSQKLAFNLFENREKRNGYSIFKDEKFEVEGLSLTDFEDEFKVMSEAEKKSKSLLNRTADGFFKFSHKSIMEYFIAKELILRNEYSFDISFEGNDAAKLFYHEMLIDTYLKYIPGKFGCLGQELKSFNEVRVSDIRLIDVIVISKFREINPKVLSVFPSLNKIYFGDPECFEIYNLYSEYLEIIKMCESASVVTLEKVREITNTLKLLNSLKDSSYLTEFYFIKMWFEELYCDSIILRAYEFEEKKPNFKNYSKSLKDQISNARVKWRDREVLLKHIGYTANNFLESKNNYEVDKTSKFLNDYFSELDNLKKLLPKVIIVY